MNKFESMNTVQKVDYLSDMLAEAIFSVGAVPYDQLSVEEQQEVSQLFLDSLEDETIVLTLEVIEAVEREFTSSPIGKLLRRYGYVVTEESQFNSVSEVLEEGKKVTLIKYSEFGFPVLIHTRIHGASIKPYAQYDESLEILHTPKRKRSKYRTRILPYNELIVYDGWLDIDFDQLTSVIEDNGRVTTKISKYCSFDKQFIQDILNHIPQQPVAMYGIK